MLKALLRKQLLEVRDVYLTGRKNKDGTRKKASNPKGLYVLFIGLYFVIMVSMFFASMGIGSALIPAGKRKTAPGKKPAIPKGSMFCSSAFIS